MKTLKFYALVILSIASMSCSKESDEEYERNEVEYVEVAIKPNLDYSIGPLTKSSSLESNDVLMLQLDQKEDSIPGSGIVKSEMYIYKDLANIKVKLVKDAYYAIHILVVKNIIGNFKLACGLDFTKASDYGKELVAIYGNGMNFMLGTVYRNGLRYDHPTYDSYFGGIFLKAETTTDLALNLVRNSFGLTINSTEISSGKIEESCSHNIFGIGSNNDIHYPKINIGETYKYPFYGVYCSTDFTDGYKANIKNDATLERYIHLRYTDDDGQTYNSKPLKVNVKRLDNIIINVKKEDFIGIVDSLKVNMPGDSSLNDITVK